MLVIKKGTEQDLDELERLYDDLNGYLEQNTNYPGWKKGLYPIREDAEKGIYDNNLFVAKDNGKIIGSIILNHEPEEAYSKVDWNNDYDYKEVFVIHTFVVHPEYLKRGIGYKLMNFAEETARKSNIKCIRLDVYRKNTPAIRLYEKCNYKYIDTVDLGLSACGLDLFKIYEKVI